MVGENNGQIPAGSHVDSRWFSFIEMMYILAQAVSHQNIESKGVYIPLQAVYKFFRIGGAEGVYVSHSRVMSQLHMY